MTATVRNNDGEWVKAIPEPYKGPLKLSCPELNCDRSFWTDEGYRGHYSLFHILKLDNTLKLEDLND